MTAWLAFLFACVWWAPPQLPAAAPIQLSETAWTQIPLPTNPTGVVEHQGDLWVYGAQEMLAFSHDQGHSWQIRHLRVGGEIIFSLSILSGGSDFVALGSGGLILKSADKGTTWQTVPNVTQPFGPGKFFDGQHAFAQFKDQILSTDDGGSHWRSHGIGGNKSLEYLVALDPTHALAGVSSPKGGSTDVLVRTVDGGKHWTIGSLPGNRPSSGDQLGEWHLIEMNGHYEVEIETIPANGANQLHTYTSGDGVNWNDAPSPDVPVADCSPRYCFSDTGWRPLAAGGDW